MTAQTFRRSERLRGKKQIEALFQDGQSKLFYPFVAYWMYRPQTSPPATFGISVAKKRYKTAVLRNRIKRRTKEAYRLQKAHFYADLRSKNISVSLMLVYIGDKTAPYKQLQKAMTKALRYIAAKY